MKFDVCARKREGVREKERKTEIVRRKLEEVYISHICAAADFLRILSYTDHLKACCYLGCNSSRLA